MVNSKIEVDKKIIDVVAWQHQENRGKHLWGPRTGYTSAMYFPPPAFNKNSFYQALSELATFNKNPQKLVNALASLVEGQIYKPSCLSIALVTDEGQDASVINAEQCPIKRIVTDWALDEDHSLATFFRQTTLSAISAKQSPPFFYLRSFLPDALRKGFGLTFNNFEIFQRTEAQDWQARQVQYSELGKKANLSLVHDPRLNTENTGPDNKGQYRAVIITPLTWDNSLLGFMLISLERVYAFTGDDDVIDNSYLDILAMISTQVAFQINSHLSPSDKPS